MATILTQGPSDRLQVAGVKRGDRRQSAESLKQARCRGITLCDDDHRRFCQPVRASDGAETAFLPAILGKPLCADGVRFQENVGSADKNSLRALRFGDTEGGILVNHNILLVDDDPRTIQILARILAPVGDLRFATNGPEALRLARESLPDLVLLDGELPGLSGFEILSAMKADAALSDVPVIFVTNHSDSSFEVAAFELGAVDFIAKPVSPPLVLARVRTQLRVKHLADELRRTATTDGLTGVANRRQFDDVFGREWLRARRAGDPLALLMIDVDYFKLYNDRYGHPAGDTCLRKVARALVGACLRPGDFVARYGGEEFVLLLPQTPRGGAEQIGQRILDAVEALAIPHEASLMARHLSASVGIGCYDDQSESWITRFSDSRFPGTMHLNPCPTDLLRAADRALYVAKHAGRAQIRLLDIADVDTPRVSDSITWQSRESRGTG